ncbi:MAG: ROK family protein [Bacteroidetes bacterium]|nr:ROK family protein [Bacteroidota bacterium]
MTKIRYSLGVDLGGTSIKIGIVSESGKIKKRLTLETHAEAGPEAVVQQIKKGIHKILKNNDRPIEGIGIGSPGLVTSKKGIVHNPPNFPGWDVLPLGNIIKKEFKTNVFVENDANAAAVGELIFGAGQGFDDYVMITLGTGVGGGIVFNKKLFKGSTGAAGEIGHLKIKSDGIKCKCGGTGCLEAYTGINYLIKIVSERLKNNQSLLNEWVNSGEHNLTPKLIHEAALKGDEFALGIINEVGFNVGSGLSSVVNVLDITNIIIGGGVAGFGKFLFDPLTKTLRENVMATMRERICVKPAKLKNNAGIKGASGLVFYKM